MRQHIAYCCCCYTDKRKIRRREAWAGDREEIYSNWWAVGSVCGSFFFIWNLIYRSAGRKNCCVGWPLLVCLYYFPNCRGGVRSGVLWSDFILICLDENVINQPKRLLLLHSTFNYEKKKKKKKSPIKISNQCSHFTAVPMDSLFFLFFDVGFFVEITNKWKRVFHLNDLY